MYRNKLTMTTPIFSEIGITFIFFDLPMQYMSLFIFYFAMEQETLNVLENVNAYYDVCIWKYSHNSSQMKWLLEMKLQHIFSAGV